MSSPRGQDGHPGTDYRRWTSTGELRTPMMGVYSRVRACGGQRLSKVGSLR